MSIKKDLTVKATVQLMISTNVINIEKLSTGKDGFYGKLCSNLEGYYLRPEATRLKMAYVRDNWNYKALVDKLYLEETNKNIEKKVESFHFSQLDWAKHCDKDLSKKVSRKEFVTSFHDHLAHKLQERGIKTFSILNFILMKY
jgi:hypothetical protein